MPIRRPPDSRLLIAPDSFKGTLSAPVVASAIGRGVRAAGWPAPDLCPVADGGEGTLQILLGALGGQTRPAQATDPLGRPVRAGFALIGDGASAIVEVAAASGLQRVSPRQRDPERASSAGTGELMLAAARAGAREIIVAAGGSASTDGGAGALEAIRRGGGLDGARVAVLCDVRTPFELAAERFGAQKGARDPATIARLTRRLDRMAAVLKRDPRGMPMSGAAGGLAGGLWGELGARLLAGAPFVLDALGFDERLRRCHAVVVGEGRLDRSSLEGKAPAEIAGRARQMGVPAHAIVASNALDSFDARILDLQVILQAGSEPALRRAGRKLTTLA